MKKLLFMLSGLSCTFSLQSLDMMMLAPVEVMATRVMSLYFNPYDVFLEEISCLDSLTNFREHLPSVFKEVFCVVQEVLEYEKRKTLCNYSKNLLKAAENLRAYHQEHYPENQGQTGQNNTQRIGEPEPEPL